MLICLVDWLTHWGRVTHICVGKLTIIGSDNGLSPDRRQAIIWTNDGILLIRPLGTNFSEILIEILTFSFTKMRLKVSSAKRWPFCLGLNVLTHRGRNGCHFTNDISMCILLNENFCILDKLSLRYDLNGLIDNIGTLVQMMACRRTGDKPLSQPMMTSFLTHICVARPQWVNDNIWIHARCRGGISLAHYFWDICV